MFEWRVNATGRRWTFPKSAVTLLTKQTQQIKRMEQELDVHIGGEAIPVQKNPKILGVTLDPQLFFHEHVANIDRRVRRNCNVLKELGSNLERATEGNAN